MDIPALQRAAKLNTERKKRARRHKVVSFLAAVVVFCTTYALILPAITMEPDYICGFEEHTHSDDCYEQRPYNTMTCTVKAHEHSEECPDDCPYASYLIHKHVSVCYDPDGKLVCTLPEITLHTHTDECYAQIEASNETDETQTSDEREEAVEAEDENGTLSENGEEQPEEQVEEVEAEENTSETAERQLVCGYTQTTLHTHSPECFDAGGNAICGQFELLEHVHTAECFATEYKDVLICEKPEHVHDDTLCLSDPANDVETEEDWILTLPSEKTGVLGTDLLAVAKSQLGYRESVTNRQVGEDGKIYGYSRYGAWNSTPYSPWNSLFVSFCMHYTNSDIFDNLLRYNANKLENLFDSCGIFASSEDYSPLPGDIAFLDLDLDGIADTLGIVSGVADGTKAILGDYKDEVGEISLDTTTVLGYGKTGEIPEDGFPDVIADNSSDSQETDTKNPLGSDSDPQCEVAYNTDEFEKLEEEGFFTYWEQFLDNPEAIEQSKQTEKAAATFSAKKMYAANAADIYLKSPSDTSSDEQIVSPGGENTSDDGLVTVSKTAEGTDIENVFDITLKVTSQTHLEIFKQDPDMAIVIVMDISNTMASMYGSVSRYQAAIESAENFIDKFDENAPDGTNASLGFVAFNTSGHKIFDLQDCTNATQATALKNELRQKTGAIINASGYSSAHTRFTNMEAGLAMAYDMLNGVKSENKYIIFLTDGFPTTYMKDGTTTYEGYDPYCTSGTVGKNGVFYDSVYKLYCNFGTSYSDKAAIRARAKAEAIKAQGAKIFSIGVDVAGQSLQKYINQGSGNYFSVVDRTGTTYDIGAANSSDSFKNWLKNKIGSGYYYDSNNSTQLEAAFQTIFDEIKRLQIEQTTSVWAAVDPLPVHSDEHKYIEFLYFYDKDGNPQSSLTGTYTEGGENTATYNTQANTINWDLKYSGYTSYSRSVTTYYTYEVKYRVRLENELDGFSEMGIYYTNDTTVLTYQDVTITNGKPVYSDVKKVEFPLPQVKGYLAEFSFTKADYNTAPLSDVLFTLTHDIENCSICRGDNTYVSTVGPYTAKSDTLGKVTFSEIPSGHMYVLTETVPDGYKATDNTYTVTVSYDDLTAEVIHSDGTTEVLHNKTGTIINTPTYAPDDESILVTKLLTMSDGSEPDSLLLSSSVFTFEIVQVDNDGNITDTPFFAPGTHFDIVENGETVGTGTVAADGTFTLKANQIAVFSQLLNRGGSDKYAVREIISSSDTDTYQKIVYTSKNTQYNPNVKTDGEYTYYETQIFDRKNTENIIFDNTVDTEKSAQLKITKRLSGTDSSKTFKFKTQLNGELIPVGTKYKVGSSTRTVTTEGIIELKADETAVLSGLLPGTEYKVTEIIDEADNSGKTSTNLALNKSVTVSSADFTANASRITDGAKIDSSVYWDGGLCPAYFTVDLGAQYMLEKFVQYGYWADGRSYLYNVYVSNDNVNFTLVADTEYLKATSSGSEIYPDIPVSARYVRLEIEGNTVNTYAHSIEFEVYGYEADTSTYEAVYTGTVSDGATFTTDNSSAEGTLPASSKAEVTVTNTAYPFSVSIPVTKTASAANNTNTFEFSVQNVEYGTWEKISDLNGFTITTTDNTATVGNVAIGYAANTTGTFYYKISEKNNGLSFIYDETFYIVEVTATGKAAYISAVYKNGTQSVSSQDISFVNSRKTDLYVSKTVQSLYTDGEFPFTATVTLNGQAVELIPPAEGANYTVEGNVISFTLHHNEHILIENLPYGAVVTVTEDIPEKTYTPFYKIEGDNLVIIPGTSASVTLDSDVKSVRFINQEYYEIPETGGIGTVPLIFTGVTLIMLAVTAYCLSKRKKKKLI